MELTLLHISFILFLVSLIIWKMTYRDWDRQKTQIFCQKESALLKKIIERCSTLNECYVPTYIWGKNGHIQSALFSIFGRFGNKPRSRSFRKTLTAKDGSIISYDLFETTSLLPAKELIVCVPGICNHSETDYVRAFAYNMNLNNYDVAVLNHTGALKDMKLTRPRLFTYGQTHDLDLMVKNLYKEHQKKMIAVGFSLGGNILVKYLGEDKGRQDMFHFAACICQGYDLPECCHLMQDWENLRRFYNYSITKNMLKVINHHKDSLDQQFQNREPPVKLNWYRIQSAKALHELDTEFSMKVYKEEDELFKWYRSNSSSQYMENIQIPMLVINSRDDPLIPEVLFKYPKKLVDKNPDALFVVPPYGGHLGFFEGGYFIPNEVSWLDRLLIDFFDTTVEVLKEENRY